MKKTFITLLLLLPTLAFGQQAESEDTAATVVDRYLMMLNIEGYSEDSMLVMETAITVYGIDDTLWMRRWFAPSKRHRMELWHKDTLTDGLISNGEDVYLHYNAAKKRWEEVTGMDFNTRISGYDFRGPLYLWRWRGSKLTWNGLTELNGKPLQVVKVSTPGMYNRFYMFDPGNGLLTLVVESKEYEKGSQIPKEESHIDWKSFHEYLPVSNHLVPSLESFMRNGRLTILSTTAHLEYIRPRMFNRE